MMFDEAGWGWWMMGIGLPVLLVLVVVAVVGVVWVARPAAHERTGTPAAPESTSERGVRAQPPSAVALEVLDVRFARGEVDEDTYRRSRDLLTRPPS